MTAIASREVAALRIFSLAMRVDKGHMFHSPLSFSDGFKSKTSQGLVIPFESSVLPAQAAFLVQCLAG